ncbi:MAG: PAS domain-containing protein [Nitrospirae bacterium]|nr:PAS domain-containing protein [Nitrospirota bacterium]
MDIMNYWNDGFDVITDMFSLHDRDCNILRANRAFAAAVNLSPKDIVGRKCHEVIHKTDTHISDCPCRQAIKYSTTVTKEIYEPLLCAYLEVTVYPLFDESDEIAGLLHSVRNVTERKNLEKEQDKLIYDLQDTLAQVRGWYSEAGSPSVVCPECLSCFDAENHKRYQARRDNSGRVYDR